MHYKNGTLIFFETPQHFYGFNINKTFLSRNSNFITTQPVTHKKFKIIETFDKLQQISTTTLFSTIFQLKIILRTVSKSQYFLFF